MLLIMSYPGNLKGYLITVLNLMLLLIIVLRQKEVITLCKQNKNKIYWKLFKTR